jgi:hypothetical protein
MNAWFLFLAASSWLKPRNDICVYLCPSVVFLLACQVLLSLSTKRAVPKQAEGRLEKGPGRFLGGGFELVAQRVIIAALQPAFLALALAGFDQVLQTPGALSSRLTTLGAATVSLHPQLVLTLARNREVCELVLNRSSHF